MTRTTALFWLGAVASTLAAVAPPAAAAPGWEHDWARGAVFYEVFVRSFADSDGDGIGDLAGLTAKLDYLNDGDPTTDADLGVDGLWLMPVFASPSYHGYDVTDYERIDPEYGTLADFERFLAEAHRRGLRVIVDLVMNHTSAQHPWFVESAASPDSPQRDWYVWRAEDPEWTQPWGGTHSTWHEHQGSYYYGIFWGGMPDLNFANPAVREEMKRLAKLWLDRGVDGFRLDATRHLFADGPGEAQNDRPETHEFLRELSAFVRGVRPDALLVGENWTDAAAIARYYGTTGEVTGGDELPLNFNFPLAAAIVEGVRTADPMPIAGALARMAELYPSGVLDAPFLTNHDMIRVATQLDGDASRLASAAAILLTLPGAPFLYYGEEVGLVNGPGSDDRQKRTPMPWDGTGRGFSTADPWFPFAPGLVETNVARQMNDPASLLSSYRRWIAARRSLPALRRGDLRDVEVASGTLAWTRSDGERRLVVVHNLGTSPATHRRRAIAPGSRAVLRAGSGSLTVAGDTLDVELPAWASAVIEID